jgi:hypothetical protein
LQELQVLDIIQPVVFPPDMLNAQFGNALRESAWFHLVFSEPAMLEASLYLAANHYSLRTAKCCNMPLANSHKGQAIHIINERLDDLSVGLSDGVMNAVFALAFGDVCEFSSPSCANALD